MIFPIYAQLLYTQIDYRDWQGKTEATKQNCYLNLKELLEKSNHTFIMILTKDQVAVFNYMKDYDLNKFITWQTKDFLTNTNYPEKGRRLKIIVLQGTGDSDAN